MGRLEKILTFEEVREVGVEWDDNIYTPLNHHDAKLYSDKLYTNEINSEGNRIPFTGLLYEIYRHTGTIAYYSDYIDGEATGICVDFYDTGELESISELRRDSLHGKYTSWHKNGKVKEISIWRSSHCLNLKEYDEQGILINEKLEPM